MKISEISIKRPVFAIMMIMALLVMGLFSYSSLSVEMWPEVDFPFVVVQTVYPGASAETIETEVTEKVEEAVNQISGIRHIVSKAQEGFTYTFVEFELDVDGPVATQDVREKVSRIRADLPNDIEEPIVTQFDMEAQGVMQLSVAGSRTPREITQLVKDRVKPRLEAVPGVGSVELVGGSEREIQVLLQPDRMESYEITVDEVKNAIAAANLEIPGGRMDEASREYLVRIKGKLTSVDQFDDIVVKNLKGTPIHLSDVATVRDTIAEQRSLSRWRGADAVALNIINQSGANIVDLAHGVREVLAELKEELPPDIVITTVNDNSVWIEDSIDEILFNIQFGTLLAVLVIFLFLLDIKPTIITGLSIPISIIATFTVMKMLGFTINFMTLLGLSLAVGILIDDSIVVVENIYRKIQEGDSPMQAAFSGTKEIGLAVAATTFSIMVVFLPVAFMSGIIGRFFYQFGMTVATSVLISLFVAFTLVPMLASRKKFYWDNSVPHLRPSASTAGVGLAAVIFRFLIRMLVDLPWFVVRLIAWLLVQPVFYTVKGIKFAWIPLRPILGLWNVVFDAIRPGYSSLLRASMKHRGTVMLVATLSFVAAAVIVGLGVIGMEFQAQTDQGKVYVTVNTPPGSTLEQTSERISQMEGILDTLAEVDGCFVSVGGDNTPVNEALLLVKLVPATERLISAQDFIDSVRTLLAVVPGTKIAVAGKPADGGSAKPVEFSIRGTDRDELARIAHRVQAIVNHTPGAADIDNTLEEGKPELHIDVDRDLADDLGLSVWSISNTVRTLVEGEVVTRYREGDEDYDVRVRLDEAHRDSERAIGGIKVASTKDVPGKETFLVPLRRVADFSKESTIGEYSRYDRLPEVRVNANPLPGYFAGSLTNEIREIVDSTLSLPPGYIVMPVGEQEIMEESNRNIGIALLLAIVFIYLTLSSQYESFWDPLSIMLSLPLSLIGAIGMLAATGSSFNIMTQVGIVMLMGLVTKNAILLVDFIKQRREAGKSRLEAILEAGPVRLRPILMTTFATVFGMLPLALGIGSGAELRAPMAQAVIGGMLSSTLLTLVVVPVVYTLIDDFVNMFRKRLSHPEESPASLEPAESTVTK